MESSLKGGNVEFAWKVEMSSLLVKGLVGIKAWTNEDDKLLLSNLKDLKGFISHFHHNFPIYPNYHHINVIFRTFKFSLISEFRLNIYIFRSESSPNLLCSYYSIVYYVYNIYF